MVDSVVFIGAAIIGVTQFVKLIAPKVQGYLTILMAVAVGVLVSAFYKQLGVDHLTLAQAIMTALAAVGVHSTVREVAKK